MPRHKPLRAHPRQSRSPRHQRLRLHRRKFRMLERWPLLPSRLLLLQQPSLPLAHAPPRAPESARTQRTRAARPQRRSCSTRLRRSAFPQQRAGRQARPCRQRGQIPLLALRPARTIPTLHPGQQSHSRLTLAQTCASRPAGSCRLRQCRLALDRASRRSRATRQARQDQNRRSPRRTRCSLLSPSCGAPAAQSMYSRQRALASQAGWARLAYRAWHARRSLTSSSSSNSAHIPHTDNRSRRRSQEWTEDRGRPPCRTSSSSSNSKASMGNLSSASPTCTLCPDRRPPIPSSSRPTRGPCRLQCRTRLTWARRAARRRRLRPCTRRRARGPARQIRRCSSSSSRATSIRVPLRPLLR